MHGHVVSLVHGLKHSTLRQLVVTGLSAPEERLCVQLEGHRLPAEQYEELMEADVAYTDIVLSLIHI